MKTKKLTPEATKKTTARNGSRSASKNGAHSQTQQVFQYPRTELEAAIQRYVDLFDFAPIGYVTFDRVGRVEEVNLTATELLGRNRHHLVGAPFAICVAKGHAQNFLHHLLQCRLSQGLVKSELHLRRSDGTEFPVLLSSTPTSSAMKNGALLYQTAIVDLTERVRAENELRESEERFRAIVSQTAAGMARTACDGKILWANQKFCEMLGYEEYKLVGKTFQEITHPDDLQKSIAKFKHVLSKSTPFEVEKRYLRKDGSILWVNISVAAMRDRTGEPESVVAVILDINERKEAERQLHNAKLLLESRVQERTAELLAANEELQNEIALRKKLEGELLEVSDREQRRLGQDLHDSLCQHLAATAFMTRALAERIRTAKAIEPAEIEKIAGLINEGVTEARMIARGLHPVQMDSAGLPMALKALVNQKNWSVPCRLEIDEEIPIRDPNVSQHLYRIAREAIINANKHAQAGEIIVRVRISKRQLELSVIDDGVGIPDAANSSPGLGWHIMMYRARAIGARLEFLRLKPNGTKIACYLPHK